MALLEHPLRNIFPGRRGGIESGLLSGQTYAQKVLSYGPIAYWPLWEAAGPTAQCLVNPAQNGTYTGVTLGQPGIGDGNTCPFFDGANDYCDIYSAAFDTALDWNQGSIALWAKVFNVGVWTDGDDRDAIHIGEDGNNYIRIGREAVNNQLALYVLFGGIADGAWPGGHSEIGWMRLGLTWDTVADEVWSYFNGVPIGGAAVTLGVPAGGALSNTITNIGAWWHTGQVWHGWLAHVVIFDTILTQPQMQDLATV